MKQKLVYLLWFVVAGLITGCVSTNDIDVESVTNEKANLKAYKNYQFLEESGFVESDKRGGLKGGSEKTAALIEEIINARLQERGKTPVAQNPDFYVVYIGGTDKDAVKVKLDENGKKIVESAPEAALLIMLIDAHTGSVLRLSTAEGELKSLPAQQQKERIEYAVKKMLKEI
jgi:hypothetical protein